MIKNSDNYAFFIDKVDEDIPSEERNENRITGNITYASFLDALGEETFCQLKNATFKRIEQISKEEVIEVEEIKLFQLWHNLQFAKVVLFKYDDWLKLYLTKA